jgi:hypothetical protein
MTTSRDDSRTVVRAIASDGAGQPTFADYRNAARAVHQADFGKEALNNLRPRGAPVLFRARAGAPAAAGGRNSAGCCGGLRRLSPCSSRPVTIQRVVGHPGCAGCIGGGSGALRGAVRHPVGRGGPTGAATRCRPLACHHRAGLLLAVLGYVAVLVTAVAVRGFVSLYRTLILGRSKEVTESGIGQVLASHWSIALCQLPETNTDSVTRETVDAVQHRVANQVAASSDDRHESVDLLVLSMGDFCEGSRRTASGPASQLVHTDPPVLVIRSDPTVPLSLPPAPAKVAGRLLLAIPWLVGGMAMVIAILAQFVARWEGEDCAHRIPAS